MKKFTLIFFSLLLYLSSYSQPVIDFIDDFIDSSGRLSTATIVNSEDGYRFPSKGTYRMLVLFVNILYDVTPNEAPNINNSYWPVTDQEGINLLPPTQYFDEVFDVTKTLPHQGFFTRFMSECSHESLILLGDFMSVSIKQSTILAYGGSGIYRFMNSVLNYINNNGGVQAIYGHNTIGDYDKATCSSNPKPISNNAVDYIAFFVLNPIKAACGFDLGTGQAGSGGLTKLKLSNVLYPTESWTMFGSGNNRGPRGLVHEFAHSLLGTNDFHTSGGSHLGCSDVSTFIFSQQGYGLFQSDNAFRSCNAYERWRLGWRHPSNGSNKIAASGTNSDIQTQFTGTQTYYLRDFVKYGDAIRIKLPYKDSNQASNQYIWLANHQVGRNGKLDGFTYHFPPPSCIPLGTPGIYSFIQVGRDILEGESNTVYFANEKDNLKVISAEGNYNMIYTGNNPDCKNWGNRYTFEYLGDNPLSGGNTKTEAIATSNLTLQIFSDFKYVGNKRKNGILYNQILWCGDTTDAFVSGRAMDISSNPSPINAYTHYALYSTAMGYNKRDNERDTRKKYLTGLSVKMNYTYTLSDGTEVFKVDIRWDDYDVKENVNWAGNIVLKEKVNVLSNKTITFEQNKTVYQINRDPVSGFFAPPTLFTCEANSTFLMYSDSKTILKERSSFVMENGSTITIQNGAEIIVKQGSTFMLKQGGNLVIQGGGKLIVEPGAYFCVQSGSNIQLQAYNSIIVMQDGAIYGANPALFSNSNCLSSISFTGSGNVINYNQDVYIQNETISTNRYIGGRNIYVGRDVTATKPIGDVIINNNANVIFDASQNVNLYGGFECTSGATFEIIYK